MIAPTTVSASTPTAKAPTMSSAACGCKGVGSVSVGTSESLADRRGVNKVGADSRAAG